MTDWKENLELTDKAVVYFYVSSLKWLDVTTYQQLEMLEKMLQRMETFLQKFCTAIVYDINNDLFVLSIYSKSITILEY